MTWTNPDIGTYRNEFGRILLDKNLLAICWLLISMVLSRRMNIKHYYLHFNESSACIFYSIRLYLNYEAVDNTQVASNHEDVLIGNDATMTMQATLKLDRGRIVSINWNKTTQWNSIKLGDYSFQGYIFWGKGNDKSKCLREFQFYLMFIKSQYLIDGIQIK